MFTPQRTSRKSDLDEQLTVNFISHFFLLELLRRSSICSSIESLVFSSSCHLIPFLLSPSQKSVPNFLLKYLKFSKSNPDLFYDPFMSYGISKLFLLLLPRYYQKTSQSSTGSNILIDKYPSSILSQRNVTGMNADVSEIAPVKCVSIHPGICLTALGDNLFLYRQIISPLFRILPLGTTSVHSAANLSLRALAVGQGGSHSTDFGERTLLIANNLNEYDVFLEASMALFVSMFSKNVPK